MIYELDESLDKKNFYTRVTMMPFWPTINFRFIKHFFSMQGFFSPDPGGFGIRNGAEYGSNNLMR
jgi:hypothetical protein